MSNQIVMVSLEDLVPTDHVYRKFTGLWKFDGINRQLNGIEKNNNYKGYGVPRLFKCLLLQFLEDLSDRELERYLQENNASKLFCGFELTEPTPDHTVFGRIRSRIGTSKLSRFQIITATDEQNCIPVRKKRKIIFCFLKNRYKYQYKTSVNKVWVKLWSTMCVTSFLCYAHFVHDFIHTFRRIVHRDISYPKPAIAC
jgi:transposase